jgi:hypothetical protein
VCVGALTDDDTPSSNGKSIESVTEQSQSNLESENWIYLVLSLYSFEAGKMIVFEPNCTYCENSTMLKEQKFLKQDC